jgi:hypothetical protein
MRSHLDWLWYNEITGELSWEAFRGMIACWQ